MGFATAKKLCDNGIKTYIIGRSKDKTEDACKEIGENAIPVIYDLNNLGGIPEMIEKLTKESPIDILVNNAGINLKKEFTDVTDEDFLSVIHTNLLSVFAVSKAVVKNMKENNG